MTGIRCFPYTPDRTRIGCQKRAPASTEIPVGLTGCAETSDRRFSDTAAHGLCVPEGQLVSSGQVAVLPLCDERPEQKGNGRASMAIRRYGNDNIYRRWDARILAGMAVFGSLLHLGVR